MRHGCSFSALALAAFLGAGGVASAADFPLKALPPPVFVWTGAYGGVNVGYSWGSSVSTTNVPDPAVAAVYLEGVRHHGWEASVEGGYCYQPGRDRDSNFVGCLEVRYDFPAERGSGTVATLPATPPTTVTTTNHIDPLLIGPHLGVTTGGNSTLWYGAGGLALGELGGTSLGIGTDGTSSTASPASRWATGWFIGAGVEQMLGANWSVKVEYDYIRLGSGGVTAQFVGTNPLLNPVLRGGVPDTANIATATVGGNPYDNVVTVGINYHLH